MKAFQNRLTDLRRSFHRDPELGFDEVRAKAKIAQCLRALGVEVHNGVTHAGGHEGQMTMLFCAGELLPNDPDFDGQVVFIFHPNKEHGLGAQAMIDGGVPDQFPMDDVCAAHNLPGASLGEVPTRAGQLCASKPHSSRPLHAADNDFNDRPLPIGATLWAQLVKDRLPTRKIR